MKTRLIVNIVKYFPVIANIYIYVISLLVLNGLQTEISNYFYMFVGQNYITNILLYYLSIRFKFCVVHRLLIGNMTLCLLLETVITRELIANIIAPFIKNSF